MKSESGRHIKFTLETPAGKHGSKSVHMHILTQDQERRIDYLWEQFRNSVWTIVDEQEIPK